MTDIPGEPNIETAGLTKAQIEEMLAGHRKEMEEYFQQQRLALKEELASTNASDKVEREQLKAELAANAERIEALHKAQQEADKVKGDSHTIVSPPANIPPPAAPPTEQPRKKSGWW